LDIRSALGARVLCPQADRTLREAYWSGEPTAGSIGKYDHAGVLQMTYSVAVENGGTNWIDLNANGKKIFYTSEGRPIKRFDVFNSVQLLDFVDLGNPGSGGL